MFLLLWDQLKLGQFWSGRLSASRGHTSWHHILQVLCAYRLMDPGSEWRLHREWYDKSAMGDLLHEDFGLAAKDNLYRCLDKLVAHKAALFSFLQERWQDLFGVTFDVLLYDLTSSYFESDPSFAEGDKRQFGYSRDKRSDCVQVVIALVVTPEGFPLAYEVMPGHTSDKTTRKGFLEKIQAQYGIEAHIFVCFLAYCVHVTLRHQLRARAPGLTVRQVLEKFERMQLMDVHFPTTDGRELVLVRYTQPEKDQQLLLAQMNWELPRQAPPKNTAKGEMENGYRPSPSQS